MSIKIINLGTEPDGLGGDTLRSSATKTNENFTFVNTELNGTNTKLASTDVKVKALEDQNVVTDNKISTNTTSTVANTTELANINTYINKVTNAASKEVGTTNGKIPLAENVPVLAKTTELQDSITAILGINKKLTNRINALEESNISSLFNNGASKGIWLDPSDIKTMYQDSAKTIPVTKDGDPVGLILDKSQGLEKVVFKTTLSDIREWLLESEGVYKANKSTDAGGSLRLGTDSPIVIGRYYTVTFDAANYLSGYVKILQPFDSGFSVTVNSNGSYTFSGFAKSTNFILLSVSGDVTISNVVITEIKGNHASQPLAASRPTYRTDGVLHWLQFDGVDDFLEVVEANKNIHSTNELSTSLVFKSGGAYTRVLWGTVSPIYSTLYSLYRNGGWQYSVTGRGKVISTLEGSNSVALAEMYSGSIENNGYFKIEGTEVVLDKLQSSGYQPTLTGNLIIGSKGEQSYYNLNGTLHGLVMVTKKFTNSERNALRTYLQRKAGVEI